MVILMGQEISHLGAKGGVGRHTSLSVCFHPVWEPSQRDNSRREKQGVDKEHVQWRALPPHPRRRPSQKSLRMAGSGLQLPGEAMFFSSPFQARKKRERQSVLLGHPLFLKHACCQKIGPRPRRAQESRDKVSELRSKEAILSLCRAKGIHSRLASSKLCTHLGDGVGGVVLEP